MIGPRSVALAGPRGGAATSFRVLTSGTPPAPRSDTPVRRFPPRPVGVHLPLSGPGVSSVDTRGPASLADTRARSVRTGRPAKPRRLAGLESERGGAMCTRPVAPVTIFREGRSAMMDTRSSLLERVRNPADAAAARVLRVVRAAPPRLRAEAGARRARRGRRRPGHPGEARRRPSDLPPGPRRGRFRTWLWQVTRNTLVDRRAAISAQQGPRVGRGRRGRAEATGDVAEADWEALYRHRAPGVRPSRSASGRTRGPGPASRSTSSEAAQLRGRGRARGHRQRRRRQLVSHPGSAPRLLPTRPGEACSMATIPCPPDDDPAPPGPRRDRPRRVKAHLETCPAAGAASCSSPTNVRALRGDSPGPRAPAAAGLRPGTRSRPTPRPSPPPPEAEPGPRPAMIGQYVIVGVLGRRGPGRRLSGRPSRTSIATPSLSSPTSRWPAASRNLLLAEGRLLAGMRHENLVEVYDVDVHEAAPTWRWSWCSGCTLSSAPGGGVRPEGGRRRPSPRWPGPWPTSTSAGSSTRTSSRGTS